MGLAVNTREAEGTLIKSSFENPFVQHQFTQAFNLAPGGAGVGILDDEVSFVFQLLPKENHSKLNEDPRLITKSSNIGLGIETHERAPVATRKSKNQAEGFLGPDLALGSFAIFGLGAVEAGGEGEGIRRGKLPPCSFSTDGLRVGVDLLEERALARDGLSVERFVHRLQSLTRLRTRRADPLGIAESCRRAETDREDLSGLQSAGSGPCTGKSRAAPCTGSWSNSSSSMLSSSESKLYVSTH